MVTIRNRVSDQDKEDFSFYNTEKLVELRYGKIFAKFRRDFFAEFGGEPESLESPPEMFLDKASAWYCVAYGAVDSRCLSFPWLVWELLMLIKRRSVYGQAEEKYQLDPLRESLAEKIQVGLISVNHGQCSNINRGSCL